MNRKDYTRPIMILTVLTVVFTILGSTFAWLSWTSSTNTLVTFTVTPDFSCSVDGGGDITSDDVSIIPTTCTNSDHAIMREVTTSVTNSSGLNVFMDLWLDVEEMGTGLSNSQNFRYALTTSATSCTTGVVASGTFNGKVKDSKVTLLDEEAFSSNSTDKYYLYIWLDSAETSTSTMNQNFSLSLNGSCTNDGTPKPYQEEILNGNGPALDNTGMIPVTIANDGMVTTIMASDSNWYSYENKQWANAVLVSNDKRSTYLGTTDKEVSSSDILAYYVWIPKYSYKMNSSSGKGNEESISISFNYNESGYTQHPAFMFDGEEIDGFWTGKFEATGSATTPTILPNATPLVSQKVSAQFTTSLLFSGGSMSTTSGEVTFGGSDTYGLSETTDSHMMKNSEWGAVAYLSHSQYGIDGEIRINNYYSGGMKTGCGADTENDSQSTTCEIAYGGATAYPQSTTGNISGIFDMSGGSWEYVMGYYSGANSNYATDPDTYFGYTSSSNYAGFSSQLDTKYWDEYTKTSATTACSGGVCYGHALSETSGWYGDYAVFVDSSFPWF